MIANLISLPVMLILSVLQMTAVSRIILINGSADLVLLAVAAWGVREKGENVYIWALVGGLLISITTAMPFLSPVIPYLGTAFLSRVFQKRLWQSPILALIITVVGGTLLQHFIYIVLLQFTEVNIGLVESLGNVTIPSLLLNFFFLFPVYVLINDIGKWITPEEVYE